jgi:threonine/homoserine/homoserine lactone efflux protein
MLNTSPAMIFAFSFLISLGAVISPGPVSAAILSESPRRGWLVGPLVASGHALLELVFISLIGFGLSGWLKAPWVKPVIALGGGFVLLAMGFGYIKSVLTGNVLLPQADRGTAERSLGALFGLGLITTLSNPFWYAWWATVVPGYLSEVHAYEVVAIGAFYFGHISADFAWDTLLSTATAWGKKWLTPTRYRLLILITGGFLIYLGITFLQIGFTSWH